MYVIFIDMQVISSEQITPSLDSQLLSQSYRIIVGAFPAIPLIMELSESLEWLMVYLCPSKKFH